jgi:hypothetical protein
MLFLPGCSNRFIHDRWSRQPGCVAVLRGEQLGREVGKYLDRWNRDWFRTDVGVIYGTNLKYGSIS